MAFSRIVASASFCVIALAWVAAARMAYQLPGGSDLILNAEVRTSFDCNNRIYGYYADVDNGCQIFHVCFPITDDAGVLLETAQFSFLCPNQTIFSQDTLTCSHTDDALPCDQAPTLYDTVNSLFGRIPTNN